MAPEIAISSEKISPPKIPFLRFCIIVSLCLPWRRRQISSAVAEKYCVLNSCDHVWGKISLLLDIRFTDQTLNYDNYGDCYKLSLESTVIHCYFHYLPNHIIKTLHEFGFFQESFCATITFKQETMDLARFASDNICNRNWVTKGKYYKPDFNLPFTQTRLFL